MSQKEFTIEALFKATGADQFARDFDRATGHVKGFDDSTKKSTGGLKNMMGGIGKIAAGIGVTKALSAGFNTLKNNVGAAVKRFDTLENANKVFENVGFEAENVDNMMQQLTKSLDGLPTSSSDAIDSIMKISMANDDIEGAGNLFQDLNYAILATGKGAEEVSGTTEMFSRALQRGSMNSHEWNSMMTNMGPTMKQMADVMGVSMEEMQKGLSDGSISMDTFGEVLHDVAENGNGDFADLETQARDMTSGIGTAFENFGNRVAEGIRSGLIIPLNEALEQNGMPQIADMVNMASSWIRDSLIAIGPFIGQVVEWFGNFFDFIQESTAVQGFMQILDALKELFEATWTAIKETFQTIIEPLMTWFKENQEEVAEVVGDIWESIKEIFIIVLFFIQETVEGVFGSIRDFVEDNQEEIGAFIERVWGAIQDVFDFTMFYILPLVVATFELMSEGIQGAMDVILGIIDVAMSLLTGDWSGAWEGIKGIIESVLDTIENIAEIALSSLLNIFGTKLGLTADEVDDALNKIRNFFDNLDLYASGKAIIQSAYDGIVSMKNKIVGKVEDIVGSIRNLWPFSPAKEGPLSDIHKMDFAGPIGKSVDNAKKPISKSMLGLASLASDSFNPTMDIAGSVARSNAQVKSAVSHEISNSGTKQPANLTVQLGKTQYRAFIEDINNAQAQNIQFESAYSL